ncbi:FUN14 domain-containing protein 1 [Lobosporangium transversale]|nr:FUN14 domain-containing protein 1 [Lobosporangium transversale]
MLTSASMLRPAAILRSTALRNATLITEPVCIRSSSPLTSFAQQSSVRFTSTAISKSNQDTPRSIFRSLAISSAFRNAGAKTPTLSFNTWVAAGTATTCIFGPLIMSRSPLAGSGLFNSSRYVAHCAAVTPALDESLINTKELTFGMAMGLCSGYLFKKLGKMMMLVVGVQFVWLQLLASAGYVQVNWTKVERRFKDHFDVDGDGKITMNDAKHVFSWLLRLLTHNFQFKSTFVTGYILGFRYG